ncbi:hypothetical protein E2C01_005587 [Portunus trituberculatus]|uniref:Uncharacterized protein n=1 Tax=Portunus trituberculatus TaxID=210409 RepID=A0A5B7CT39_PORTR|nr:hypothetical protein [Portunus trituberculatus]
MFLLTSPRVFMTLSSFANFCASLFLMKPSRLPSSTTSRHWACGTGGVLCTGVMPSLVRAWHRAWGFSGTSFNTTQFFARWLRSPHGAPSGRIITPFSVKRESLRLHESLVKATGKLRRFDINNLK